LQYFIGQLTYSNELPFDPSVLVHFRRRINPNQTNKVNKRLVEKMREVTERQTRKKKDSDAKNESSNRGKLIVDAPSAPADISYPTDLYHFHKIVLQLVGIVFVSQFPNIRKKNVSRGFGLKFGKQQKS
jgi:hypothetical protein